MNNSEPHLLRIGCGSGFWGDTPEGARQLILAGAIDYLILDYLAEVTMSILARAREKSPTLGYATDFVSQVIRPYARELAARRIKVIVNAGGVNPHGCVEAIRKELAAQGVALRVAAVVGDDVMHLQQQWRAQDVREMFSGEPVPPVLISANAYLGAVPIALALDQGADIVVTGRCADSALALGALVHGFKWQPNQFDHLSTGTLVGHVLECGAQVTGGFSTDWEETAATWAHIGFPIAECSPDGSFVVTKPAGTGGAVTVQNVTEQVTYETGDPARYLMPDVVCDWRHVRVTALAPDRVEVRGAVGLAPTASYKVSATYADGFRCMATILIRGMQAAAKARAVATAILDRTQTVLAREGFGELTETSVELLGTEDAYGEQSRTIASREVVLKVGVRHREAKALDIFAREIFPTSTSTVQGVSGVFGGRPKVQPVVRLFSFLQSKVDVPITVELDGRVLDAPAAYAAPESGSAGLEVALAQPAVPASSSTKAGGATCVVPLVAIAYARSGDKGDLSNIAVMARSEEFVPLLREQLTPERVQAYLSHLVKGKVERFEWPGLQGFNFLMYEALGGGGAASLRYDPQGKAHAQILLEFPVEVSQLSLARTKQ